LKELESVFEHEQKEWMDKYFNQLNAAQSKERMIATDIQRLESENKSIGTQIVSN
jgi:hypothetical protein